MPIWKTARCSPKAIQPRQAGTKAIILSRWRNRFEHLRLYYTELLSGYPDVLTTQAVSKITGYSKTSINNWCNQGYIKSFRKNNVNHIPKVYLVEFFCSTYFRTITRKPPWHIRTLQGFSSWRKIRDLHTAEVEGGAE